jgi:hypothetical protein
VPAPFNATLPPFFTLTKDYSIRVTALDPTDGSLVAGVITSNVSLAVDQEDTSGGGPDVQLSGAFLPGV